MFRVLYLSLATIFFTALIAGRASDADAACLAQSNGVVSCLVSTHTTNSANVDGRQSSTNDREQRFDNGSPIMGTIGPGVVISGSGLELSEAGGRNHPAQAIGLVNNGTVSATGGLESLGFHGNGGAVNYSGTGTVTSSDNTAIFVHNQGPVTLTLDGDIEGGVPAPSRGGHHKSATPPAVKVLGLGRGDILVGGIGNVVGRGGRGIWAEQTTGFGGISVTGTGNTAGQGLICPGVVNFQFALSKGKTGCSGIRAVIDNAQNASNILVHRSGDISGTSTAINAFTFGRGNVTVATGATAAITGVSEFGIEAAAKGTKSSGTIRVVTGTSGTLTSGGDGIFAVNNASQIGKSRSSSIIVDANGSIDSGGFPLAAHNDKNPTNVLGGISAGYVGGTTATINDNVYGSLMIDDKASILARTGDGVVAYNFGRGPLSVLVKNTVTAQSGDGISTTSGSGSTRVDALGATITATGDGYAALNGRSATGTIDADIDQGSVLRGENGAIGIALAGPFSQVVNHGLVQGGSFSSRDRGSNLRGVGILGANIAIDNSGTISGGIDTATHREAAAILFDGGLNHIANSGRIDGVDVIGSGAFMPALAGSRIGAPLMIQGPLRFASTAEYDIRLIGKASDSVQTTGTASLGAARLNISTGGQAPPPGRRFTILSAAQGVSSHFGSVVTDLAFLQPMIQSNGTRVSIVTAYNFQPTGSAANEAFVGGALNRAMTISPVNSNVLLGSLEHAAAGQGASLLSALSGDGLTSDQNLAFRASQLFGDTIFDRMAAYGTGASGTLETDASPDFSADATATDARALPREELTEQLPVGGEPLVPRMTSDPRWRAWASAFGGAEDVQGNTNSGAASQNISLYGGILGVDYQVLTNDRIGIALGGSSGSAPVPDRTTSSTSTGGHIAIYNVASFQHFYAAAATSFSSFENRDSRLVAGFGGLASEDEISQFASHEVRSRVEFGRPWELRGATIVPFVSLEFAELRSGGFSEHSATGPGNFALDIKGQRTASAPGALGARFVDNVALGSLFIARPLLQLAYVHEFSSSRDLVATFNDLPGSTFLVEGARPARDAAQVKGGCELAIGTRSVVFATLDTVFSRTNQYHGGRGGFLYLW